MERTPDLAKGLEDMVGHLWALHTRDRGLHRDLNILALKDPHIRKLVDGGDQPPLRIR